MSEIVEVQIYLHTTLVSYSPDGETRKFAVQLTEPSTVNDILTYLEITHEAAELLFAVNGEVADETTPLKTGDIVHLMLPISGG